MTDATRALIAELRAFADRLHDLALEPDIYRHHFADYRRAVTELQRTIESIEMSHYRADGDRRQS